MLIKPSQNHQNDHYIYHHSYKKWFVMNDGHKQCTRPDMIIDININNDCDPWQTFISINTNSEYPDDAKEKVT